MIDLTTISLDMSPVFYLAFVIVSALLGLWIVRRIVSLAKNP